MEIILNDVYVFSNDEYHVRIIAVISAISAARGSGF